MAGHLLPLAYVEQQREVWAQVQLHCMYICLQQCKQAAQNICQLILVTQCGEIVVLARKFGGAGGTALLRPLVIAISRRTQSNRHYSINFEHLLHVLPSQDLPVEFLLCPFIVLDPSIGRWLRIGAHMYSVGISALNTTVQVYPSLYSLKA